MAHDPRPRFLEVYDREHATTLRVLRAYPEGKLDLKVTPSANSAGRIAWTIVLERYLGTKVWNDEFAKGVPAGGTPPKPPETMAAIIAALEEAQKKFRALIAAAPVESLYENVHFMTAPKTLGALTRIDWLWFLLHDEIHHRGQLSVYLRMAGAHVPSIYGPTADEPWV